MSSNSSSASSADTAGTASTVIISLKGSYQRRPMGDANISSGAIIELFRHAYGIELRAVKDGPSEENWVFTSEAGNFSKVRSHLELPNPDLVTMAFRVQVHNTNQSKDAVVVNRIPNPISARVVFVGQRKREEIVRLEAGFLHVHDRCWDVDSIAATITGYGRDTISLIVDNSPLLTWSDKSSPVPVSQWKIAFDLHKEYAKLRNTDSLGDRMAETQVQNDSGTLHADKIYLRKVVFEPFDAAGKAAVEFKLFFKDKKMLVKQDKVLRPACTVKYDAEEVAFTASTADLKSYKLVCEADKVSLFRRKPLRSDGVVPLTLVTSPRGQEVSIGFELRDDEGHFYGILSFHFFRPAMKVLLSSHEFLIDPYVNFRVVRVTASSLPNVEWEGGKNDPFVKISRVGTSENWKLKTQDNAGESAEWKDSSIDFPVGICLSLRKCQLEGGNAASRFHVEVYDANSVFNNVLIGNCDIVFPGDLMNISADESFCFSHFLGNKERGWKDMGRIEFELKRAEETPKIPESPAAPSNEGSALGSGLIGTGLTTEQLIVSLVDNVDHVETFSNFQPLLRSIFIVLHLQSGNRLALTEENKHEVTLDPVWSLSVTIPGIECLGALWPLLEDEGSETTFFAQGYRFSLQRRRMGRSVSLMNTLVESMNSADALPPSVERDALQFHHLASLLAPDARTKREPLSQDKVKQLLDSLRQLQPASASESDREAVELLLSFCSDCDSENNVFNYRYIADSLQKLVKLNEVEHLKRIPDWLLTASADSETIAVQTDGKYTPVRLEEKVKNLLDLFDEQRQRVAKSNSFTETLLLLVFHYEILYLIKFPCSREELDAAFSALKSSVQADIKFYGRLVSSEISQIEAVLNMEVVDYNNIKLLADEVIHKLRPVDVHQLQWSVDFARKNNTDHGSTETVVSLGGRAIPKRIEDDSTSDATRLRSHSTHADASVKCNQIVYFFVASEGDLPLLARAKYSSLKPIGEACFGLNFPSNGDKQEYISRLLCNSAAFGFEDCVRAKSDTATIDLFSHRAVQLIQNQFDVSEACIMYYVQKVISGGDVANESDIEIVKSKIAELSVPVDIACFSRIASKTIVRITTFVRGLAKEWVHSIENSLDTFLSTAFDDCVDPAMLERIATPLSSLYNLKEFWSVPAIRGSDEQDPFLIAIGKVVQRQYQLCQQLQKAQSLNQQCQILAAMRKLEEYFSKESLAVTHPLLSEHLESLKEDELCFSSLLNEDIVEALGYISSKTNSDYYQLTRCLLSEGSINVDVQAAKGLLQYFSEVKSCAILWQSILSKDDFATIGLTELLATMTEKLNSLINYHISAALSKAESINSATVEASCLEIPAILSHIVSVFEGTEFPEFATLKAGIANVHNSIAAACLKAANQIAGSAVLDCIDSIKIVDCIFGLYTAIDSNTEHVAMVVKVYEYLTQLVETFETTLGDISETSVVPEVVESLIDVLRKFLILRSVVTYSPTLLCVWDRFSSILETACIPAEFLTNNQIELQSLADIVELCEVWKRLHVLWALRSHALPVTEKIKSVCKNFQIACTQQLNAEWELNPESVKIVSILSYLSSSAWIDSEERTTAAIQIPAMLEGSFKAAFKIYSELSFGQSDNSLYNCWQLFKGDYIFVAKSYLSEYKSYCKIQEMFNIESNTRWCGLGMTVLRNLPCEFISKFVQRYISECDKLLKQNWNSISHHLSESVRLAGAAVLCLDVTIASPAVVANSIDLHRAEQALSCLHCIGRDISEASSILLEINPDVKVESRLSAIVSLLSDTRACLIEAQDQQVMQLQNDVSALWAAFEYDILHEKLTSLKNAHDPLYDTASLTLNELVGQLLHRGFEITSGASIPSQKQASPDGLISFMVTMKHVKDKLFNHLTSSSDVVSSYEKVEGIVSELVENLRTVATKAYNDGNLPALKSSVERIKLFWTSCSSISSGPTRALSSLHVETSSLLTKEIELLKQKFDSLANGITSLAIFDGKTNSQNVLNCIPNARYANILDGSQLNEFHQLMTAAFCAGFTGIRSKCHAGTWDIDACRDAINSLSLLMNNLFPNNHKDCDNDLDLCIKAVEEQHKMIQELKAGILSHLKNAVVALEAVVTWESGLMQMTSQHSNWAKFELEKASSANLLDKEIIASITQCYQKGADVISSLYADIAPLSNPLLVLSTIVDRKGLIRAILSIQSNHALSSRLIQCASSAPVGQLNTLLQGKLKAINQSIRDDITAVLTKFEAESKSTVSKQEQLNIDTATVEEAKTAINVFIELEKVSSIVFPEETSSFLLADAPEVVSQKIREWTTLGQELLNCCEQYTPNLFVQEVSRLGRLIYFISQLRYFKHLTIAQSANNSLKEFIGFIDNWFVLRSVPIREVFAVDYIPNLVGKIANGRTSEEIEVTDDRLKSMSRNIFFMTTLMKEFNESPLWSLPKRNFSVSRVESDVNDLDYTSLAGIRWIENHVSLLLRECEMVASRILADPTDTHVVPKVANICLDLWFLAEGYLSMFSASVTDSVSKIVHAVKSAHLKKLMDLYCCLTQVPEGPRAGVGDSMVNSMSEFRPFTIARDNEERNTTTEEELLDRMTAISIGKGPAIDFSAKKAVYKQYLTDFKTSFNEWVNKGDKSEVVHAAKYLAYETVAGMSPQKDCFLNVRNLLAMIFACWTLDFAEKLSLELDEEAEMKARVLPNSGQVLSLLVLFENITVRHENGRISVQVENQFIQIGTGEGKSVTIAVAAIVFTLLGMDVDCTCYSSELCTRDRGAFDQLFRLFAVDEHISYQTFNKQCEKFITKRLRPYGGVQETFDYILNVGRLPEVIAPRSVTTPGLSSKSPVQKFQSAAKRALLRRAVGARLVPSSSNNLLAVTQKAHDFKSFNDMLATLERNSVLIMDEADMFFSSSFCGEQLPIVTYISSPSFAVFLSKLWEERDTYLRVQDVLDSELFQKLKASAFDACWCKMLEGVVHEIIHDRETFIADQAAHNTQNAPKFREDPVKGLRVLYAGADGAFTDSLTLNYQTTFAYLQEALKKYPREQILKSQYLALPLTVGKFSFSEIPKSYLQHGSIVGVSGTLEQMLPVQRRFMHDQYGLERFTIMPCCYGDKSTRFKFLQADLPLPMRVQPYPFSGPLPDIRIVSEREHFAAITAEVIARLKDNGDRSNDKFVRSLLVFFETNELVAAYEKSQAVALRDAGCAVEDIHVLNSYRTSEERKWLIKDVDRPKIVTLCSREYDRGWDFIIHNSNLIRAGGVHVISTFLAEEITEEVQTKGRTARRTNPGSFSMVLSTKGLWNSPDWSSVPTSFPRNATTREAYRLLDEMRNDSYRKVCTERFAKLPDAFEQHNLSHKLIDNIIEGSFEPVVERITAMNSPEMVSPAVDVATGAARQSRTVVLIDATSSMTNLMSCVKNSLQFLFDYLSEAIGAQTNLVMQILLYRNYSDGPERILEHSIPSTNPQELINFVNERGNCFGGGSDGREAIEVALRYINEHANEFEPTQLVIIGDASYNTSSSTMRNTYAAQVRNPRVWSHLPETNFQREKQRLARLRVSDRQAPDDKVKVHTFFVEKERIQRAEEAQISAYRAEFQAIANEFSGRAFILRPRDTPETRDAYLRDAGTVILQDLANSEAQAAQYQQQLLAVITRRAAYVAGST